MEASIVQGRTPLLMIEPVLFLSSSTATDTARVCEGCGVREATRGPLCDECEQAVRQAARSGCLDISD